MSLPSPVAVTGALGFVAGHLVPRLRERGCAVLAIVRPGRDASAVEAMGAEIRRADLTDAAAVTRAADGAAAVVHLAGMSLGPVLAPALEAARVRAGVFVSSAGVHTKLESRGADAKRAGEEAVRRSSFASVVLRPSMIYGTPRDRNLVRLLRWLERCPIVPAPLGGSTLQQPVHVDDLVSAILASLERDAAAGHAYETGGPEPLTLRAMIGEAARALGRRAIVLPIPLAPAHAAAVVARRLRVPFPVRPEQVLRLVESKAVDIEPARRDLGFAPRPFSAGIEAEVRLLREARRRA